MALINLTEFEQEIGSFLPFIGSAIDYTRSKELSKAISTLYNQTDVLAILTVQEIAAFLWWAAHIAASTGDALGYSAQIEAALNAANRATQATWAEWVNVKHPADLNALYRLITAEIEQTLKARSKALGGSLGKLQAEIVALQKWRKHTVTPTLVKFVGFYGEWNKTYRPPIDTLRNWLREPGKFAEWAIVPLIHAAPAAVAKPAAKRSATAIEQALVATWTNDPKPIWNVALNFLVTEL
jgi:hypothetical protein